MNSLQNLCIPARSGKPRKVGLTVITDYGPDIMGWMGRRGLEDYLEIVGQFVDCAKFHAAGTLVLGSEAYEWIRQKVNLYNKFGVEAYPGGIMSEIAILQDKLDDFFKGIKELGFTSFELSENFLSMEAGERDEIIRRATQEGLEVIYEYGRKFPKEPFDAEEVVELVEHVTALGAKRVVIERFEIDLFRNIPGRLQDLIEKIGMEKLVLEADPNEFPNYHIWLIDTLGPEVSLGNIAPGQVIRLEQYRRGLGIPVGYRFLTEKMKNS